MKRETGKFDFRTVLMLWLIVGVGSLYIFHTYIIGDYTVAFYDVGTDGKDQYIMWYNGIVNSLRDGNFSAWDFRNGFGMNTMGHHLTEPFLMPIYLLGYLFGPEHITYYMVWMEIFRIFVGATVGYWYLSEFDFSEKSKLIASVMYALNAYVMVWGQHYALGSSVVFFPVILLYAERVIRRRRFGIGLCLISCITMMSSFYQGYMCMFGGGAYICIRLLMLEDVKMKERGKAFFLGAGSMILGVVMSSFRFLPSAAAQVGSSARMASQTSLFERIFALKLWDIGINKSILYRMFSSCIQGNGNEVYVGQRNFYEDPNLFFSTFFIILLLQYLCLIPRMKESRKSKCMQYFVTGLCISSVVVTNVTTLFNGLYAPFFRHTFVLMPVFAVMSAKVLDYIFMEKKISYPALVCAVLGITAVYWKAYTILPEIQFKNNAMALWMTGIFMAVLLVLYCRGICLDRKTCYMFLVLTVSINMVSDSFLCYNYRVALQKSHPEYYQETYHSDVDAALDWIEENDPTFYRVEKDYFTSSSCFDSLAQDYRGISAYNSNQNADIKAFVANVWPQLNHERDVNHIQFQNAIWDNTFAALTDVKYVLTKSSAMNLAGYQMIHQQGEVYIYQNENTDSLGKFYTKTITEKQFEERKDILNTRELLKEVLIVAQEDAFTLSDSELSEFEKNEIANAFLDPAEDKYEASVDANGNHIPLEIELNFDQNVLSEYTDVILQFTIFGEKRTVVDISLDDGYTHSFVQNWKEERDIHIEIPEDAKKITIKIEEPSGFIKLNHFEVYGSKEKHTFNSTTSITIDAPKKDSLLTGTISAKETGYVMLAIPNENGWNVYLNGEQQQLIDGDYGFITFAVDAGEYDLTVRFTAPLLKVGIWLSCAGFLLFVLMIILEKRKNKGVK